MSKFMKSFNLPDNTYKQFRFESSLRKYQKQPTKKIKCDPAVCRHCLHHRNKKYQKSPFSARKLQNSITKKTSNQQNIQIQKSINISESKTIKIAKKQVLEQSNGNCDNNLEKKIYQSLMNIDKQNKQISAQIEDHCSMEEDVYLNDFEQPQFEDNSMNVEIADINFGNIQIAADELQQKNQQFQEKLEQMDQNFELKRFIQIREPNDNEQIVEKRQNLKPLQQQIGLIVKNQSNEMIAQGQKKNQNYCSISFEGSRIHINFESQNFYISTRVFNKSIKKYNRSQNITNLIIQQRPYLERIKEVLQQKFQNYLTSDYHL